jgi:hypothetical protein
MALVVGGCDVSFGRLSGGGEFLCGELHSGRELHSKERESTE